MNKQILKIYYDYKKYIGKNPHLIEQGKIAEFALYAMDACIELRDIKNAKKLQSVCIFYYKQFGLLRYQFMDVMFLFALHTNDYRGALKIYMEATKSPLFKKLDHQFVERWNLYNVYLHFVLPGSGENTKINPLKLINNMPSYSMDKSGFYFPILIGEFICILKGDFYDELLAFKSKFSLYVRRYVSRKTHYRTWYFSKLILLLYKYEFDAEKCREIGDKFHKRLLDFRKRKLRDDQMVEIVPYEKLWMHIINFLEQKG